MSTANAAWLYNNSKVGDVVEYTGTYKRMDLTNGFGDWNASFQDYRRAPRSSSTGSGPGCVLQRRAARGRSPEVCTSAASG